MTENQLFAFVCVSLVAFVLLAASVAADLRRRG